LIWVSKSMEKLPATLTETGHPISADTVRTELVKLGFSRQSKARRPGSGMVRVGSFRSIWLMSGAPIEDGPPGGAKADSIGRFSKGNTVPDALGRHPSPVIELRQLGRPTYRLSMNAHGRGRAVSLGPRLMNSGQPALRSRQFHDPQAHGSQSDPQGSRQSFFAPPAQSCWLGR
jgi:hypothetical protein